MTENTSEQQDRAPVEHRLSAVEHKLLADLKGAAEQIANEANQNIRAINNQSFGALQLIILQRGLKPEEWEVAEGFEGLRRKEKPEPPAPPEPPKEPEPPAPVEQPTEPPKE